MADTAEGKIKKKIKNLLANSERWGYLFFNFPVPAGYGTPMLDVVGCYKGFFFAIEAKAPGKKPTKRQRYTIKTMVEAEGAVFVIDGDASLQVFETWLETITQFAEERDARLGSFSRLNEQRARYTSGQAGAEPVPPREDAT